MNDSDDSDGSDDSRDADDPDVTWSSDDRRPGPAAAYASNWRTVLAVDAGMGLVALVVGLVLTVRWNPVGGGFIASAGLAYLLLVAKRGRDWAALRDAAGFPPSRR